MAKFKGLKLSPAKLYLLGVKAVWERTRAGKNIFSLHREPSTTCTLGLQYTIQVSAPVNPSSGPHLCGLNRGFQWWVIYVHLIVWIGVKTSLRKRTKPYATWCWKRIHSACKVITVSHEAYVVSEPWACPMPKSSWFCIKGQGVEFVGLSHFSFFPLQYPQAFCLEASRTPACLMERLSWGFLAPRSTIFESGKLVLAHAELFC